MNDITNEQLLKGLFQAAAGALDAGDLDGCVDLLKAAHHQQGNEIGRKSIEVAIEEIQIGSVEKATAILDILAL